MGEADPRRVPEPLLKRPPRTFGKATYLDDRNEWRLELEPHVSMRAKQVFQKIRKSAARVLHLTATDENCRELEWFMERFPLEVSHPDVLEGKAREFDRTSDIAWSIIQGEYEPPEYGMVLPPREYQSRAAQLCYVTRGLLLADDLGLGKTVSAITLLANEGTLPALVVVPTHLQRHWKSQIGKFMPALDVHIIKTKKPYALDKTGRAPDVVVSTYHKLGDWVDSLAGFVETVVFDECQELRRGDSVKYESSRMIADAAKRVCGLSVGPQSVVELRGGPFGSGFCGPVCVAWDFVESPTSRSEGYEIKEMPSGVYGRGWDGDGFSWKRVRKIIRHPCDRRYLRVKLGGLSLELTDDHSVFVASSEGFEETRGGNLQRGDTVPVDNGRGWEDGIDECPLDIVKIAASIPQSQLVVDFGSTDRHALGLTAWQWQNYHREAKYGPRVPVPLYLEHSDKLKVKGPVYVGRGKGSSCAPSVMLSTWAYILGFYLGDGWVEGSRVGFAVEEARVEDFLQRLTALPLDLRPKITKARGASYEVRCSDKMFAEILLHVFGGAKCYEKDIPSAWVLSWPREARCELVRGMVDSDDHDALHTRNRRRSYYSTTSLSMARSLLSLLRSLGVRGGIHVRPPGHGGVIRGRLIQGKRPSYMVHWSSNQIDGITSGRRGHSPRYHGNFNEANVSSWEEVDAPEHVYDLEMAGHPSFVADGLLVHNSATPIYNYGVEFWNVLRVIRPHALGTKDEFIREWCIRSYNEDKSKVADPKAFGTYLREQGLMLRRTKKDVGRELPPVVRIVEEVDSNSKILEEAEDAASELATILLSQETSGGDRFTAAGQFDAKLRQITGLAKAPFVAEFVKMLVEQTGDPVVLFGWHRDVYSIWQERLKELNPVLFTGSESPKQKQDNFEKFLRGESKVLMMSLRSGSGMDGLQHVTSSVVIGELDWSPGALEQCIGRVSRDGQEESVFVYYLTARDGADPVMIDVLGVKRQQIEGVRDPDAVLAAAKEGDPAHVRKLAEAYLKSRKSR